MRLASRGWGRGARRWPLGTGRWGPGPPFGLCPPRLELAARDQRVDQVSQAIESELPNVVGGRECDGLRAAARERPVNNPERGLVRDRHGAVRSGCKV